ncbi:MAG: hypothetical protein ABIQ18_23520 [Umezawaea sp.]
MARRGQAAHLRSLEAGVTTIARRLSLPIGQKGGKREPGGYRCAGEWFQKKRRLTTLETRLAQVRADRDNGRVRVVRGGKRLLNTRHNLDVASPTETEWRERWEAERWFLQADGESGKRYGNETIRVTSDGEVSIKLPAPLAEYANAKHGRYVVTARVAFAHRGAEWVERISADRAVAYRVHLDAGRSRWYITASWQRPPVPDLPLPAAVAVGVVGVDMNADHLAAWRLDRHGNPAGEPRRFDYILTGTAEHRDAQVRHAPTRLLRWTKSTGVTAIAVEDLDFTDSKTREKHGRRKRFRQMISGMPTAKLRARLVSMAGELGVSIIAVDPAYTSMWGAQHWQKPLASTKRKVSRHDSAAVAIGRRALGYPIRRRTAPPPHDQSDRAGHRTAQARPGSRRREETRAHRTGPRTRSDGAHGGANTGNQDTQHRSGCPAEQNSLLLSP